MRWDELADQNCSVARTISVIGDRWTLLVLRDCFLRIRRFEDFQTRLGIGRGILADRLQKLVEAGVLAKVAYQDNPVRHEYKLTPRGLDLHPVIMAIVHWGDVHMDDGKGAPAVHLHRDCGCEFHPVMTCSACHEPVAPRAVQVRPGPGAAPGRSPYGVAETGDISA
jgi:DNA-binding HxlR family transcriptional regulator